jgi:hypothetical protein
MSAFKDLAEKGIHVKKTGYGTEHRVNYKNGREETAYYASDKDDARDTGHHMAKNAMREYEHPYWADKRGKPNK